MSAQIDHSKHEHLYWLAEKLFEAGIFAQEVTSVARGFAVLLAGDEMGFAPMVAARSFCFVKNKLQLNADAQVAVVVRHADICTYFRLVESTTTRAVYTTLRAGHPEPVMLEYTIEQARTAGLANGGTWKAHPASMLRARCSGALAKAVYPDLVAGLVDPDEAEEIRRVDGIAPAQTVAEAPARQAEKTTPVVAGLAAYRERIAAAKSPDALVATVLELMPSVRAFRDAASAAAGARADELNVDLPKLIAEAEAMSTEPAHWSVVAKVLVPLVDMKTTAELKALATAHAEAVMKLPEALRKRLSDTLNARRRALKAAAEVPAPPPMDTAALLEDEIRRASTLPEIDAVHDKITASVTASSITPDQAKALVDQYNRAANALEHGQAA